MSTMSTVDNFLNSFQDCLNNVDEERRKEFNDVTEYFEKNNPQFLHNFYKDAHDAKIAMADKIVLMTLNIIIRLNMQIHIINVAFRTTLLDYVEWRSKTLSESTSVGVKADHIMQILVVQIKQFEKFAKAKPEDKWVKGLEVATNATEFDGGFI